MELDQDGYPIKPEWMNGVFNSSRIDFFESGSKRKVHVAKLLGVPGISDPTPVELLSLLRPQAICGVWSKPYGPEVKWVGAFNDEQLCARCHKVAGAWSDELFNHPQL